MIDIHSHLLPGIDDGARSMEEAVEMAGIAAADGIEWMVSTPHMFNGFSKNPEPSDLLERIAALNEAINSPAIRILPGNEVHLSHEIAEQSLKNRVLRINQQNYMLVEFPMLSIPIGADELLHKLLLQGVIPILVHPERNREIQSSPHLVAHYIERGVLIQITAMSVTGEFGTAAHTCAETLLHHDCVHFLATDAHRSHQRPPILSKGRDAAAAIIGIERALALVESNPSAVIEGRPVGVRPPVPFGFKSKRQRSFFSRFFSR